MLTPLDEILVQALGQYDFFGSGPVVRKVAEKLATKGFFHEGEFNRDDLFQIVEQLVSAWGAVIDLQPDEGMIMALVGSGGANLNPTVLLLRVQGKRVEAIAAAKEGLINQHSGEKAVKRFFALLEEICQDEIS